MAVRRFASIDVGSFEIEMGIYEIDPRWGIRRVDSVRHVIALGSDTYNNGVISFGMVQELVAVLKDFTEIMTSYQCTAYRAIATSAMREARNSMIVLDQIETQTGLKVEIISNPEQRILVLKALAARGEKFDELIKDGTAIVEMGFGSTQITLYDEGAMVSTQNLNLGALRIRDTLGKLNSARDERNVILSELVDHELDFYNRLHLRGRKIKNIIAVGDPVRILFDRMMRREDRDPLKEDIIGRKDTNRFCEYITGQTASQLEDSLALSEENSGVMIPAAIFYGRIVELSKAEKIWFPGVRLIDGLAAEYAMNNKVLKHPRNFDDDILSAVREIAARYGEETAHREFSVENTLKVFDAVRKSQGFGERDRLLLQAAALLHHCGRFINMGRASLSSYDIIHATELVGLSDEEHELISQALQYEEGKFLWSEIPMKAAKFTAMIRLADALDRSAKLKARDYVMKLDDARRLVISTKYKGDMTLEHLTFEQNKQFFSDIFGIEPVFQQKRSI